MRLHLTVGDLEDAVTFSHIAEKTAFHEHRHGRDVLSDDAQRVGKLQASVVCMGCANERALDKGGQASAGLVVVESLDALGSFA